MSGLTVLAAVFVLYALVASKLDHWWITAPMVFVVAGATLGPAGLQILPLSLDSESTVLITGITLALLLFADASTVRLRDVEGDASLANRLLFVGLPLTVLAGMDNSVSVVLHGFSATPLAAPYGAGIAKMGEGLPTSPKWRERAAHPPA